MSRKTISAGSELHDLHLSKLRKFYIRKLAESYADDACKCKSIQCFKFTMKLKIIVFRSQKHSHPNQNKQK